MTQDNNNRSKDPFGAPPPSIGKSGSNGCSSPPSFKEEPAAPKPAPQPPPRAVSANEPVRPPTPRRPSNPAAQYMPWILTGIIFVLSFVHHNSQANEIAELKKQAEQTRTELQSARSEYESLKAENAQLKDEVEQANRPQAEVIVSFNKPVFGNGYYARIVNTGSSTSVYSARISRPTTGTGKTWNLTIDAGRFTDIGEQEGWPFILGDTITITQSNHKSLTWTLR